MILSKSWVFWRPTLPFFCDWWQQKVWCSTTQLCGWLPKGIWLHLVVKRASDLVIYFTFIEGPNVTLRTPYDIDKFINVILQKNLGYKFSASIFYFICCCQSKIIIYEEKVLGW